MLDLEAIGIYLKENWKVLFLLAFTAVQCISTVFYLFQKRWDSFFMCAPVYFPTLILLIAGTFLGLSWPALTGYVVGISLTLTLALWGHTDGTATSGELITNAISTVMICLHLL